MDENTTIDQLENLAERLRIQIRYESMKQDEDSLKVVGGLCLLRGKYVFIMNSNAMLKDRINAFVMALKHFDLDQIYIRPALRNLLDQMLPVSQMSSLYPRLLDSPAHQPGCQSPLIEEEPTSSATSGLTTWVNGNGSLIKP